MSAPLTQIDFLRHGEPVGGAGRYRGQIDDPLSDLGWTQMRAATAGQRPWSRIVSSPLHRCCVFAEILAAEMAVPLHLEPRLQEIGFGVWEGKTSAEIEAHTPGALARFRADPVGQRPTGAEPLVDFSARIAAACDALLSDFAGEHILVVSHAGVMRAVFAYALDVPLSNLYRIRVGNAEFSRYQWTTDGQAALLAHGVTRI